MSILKIQQDNKGQHLKVPELEFSTASNTPFVGE